MRLLLHKTRKALGNEVMRRLAKEDPDWAGAALCDLKHCFKPRQFQIWAEEYGIENINKFMFYADRST